MKQAIILLSFLITSALVLSQEVITIDSILYTKGNVTVCRGVGKDSVYVFPLYRIGGGKWPQLIGREAIRKENKRKRRSKGQYYFTLKN